MSSVGYWYFYIYNGYEGVTKSLQFHYSTVTDCTLTTPIPYLTFICRYRTHEFGYTKELTDNSHQKLHDIISKLKHEGLGYRKILKKHEWNGNQQCNR